MESLVTDIVTNVLIRFPIIAQCSKGTPYFHTVVGLVVINIRQWSISHCNGAVLLEWPGPVSSCDRSFLPNRSGPKKKNS